MFNRYWRAYPWWMQTLLFFLTIFTLYSFGSYLVLTLVPKMYHISLKDILQLSPASQPRRRCIQGNAGGAVAANVFGRARQPST